MALTAPDIQDQPINAPRIQANASPESFGGGQGLEAEGQAGKALGTVGGEMAALERVRADQTAYQEAAAKLGGEASKILYDPQAGVLTSKGTNAMPAHDKGWETFRKTANDIAGTLHGEAQVGAFNKYALTLGQEFNRTAMAHVSRQLDEHDTKTFNAFVQNTTDFGAMTYGDPMTRQRSIQSLNTTVDHYAQRNGFGPEEKQELQSKVISNFHDQVISRMLVDKNDMMAQKYFAENKDSITNSAIREKVEKQLEEGSYRGESLRQSTAIWDKTGGNLQASFADARKIQDPELQDRTIQRLRERDNQVKEARTSDQDNAYFEGSHLLAVAKQNGKTIGDQSLTDIVPPETWTRMSPTQQGGLRRMYLGGDENSEQVWTAFSLMSPTEKAGLSKSEFETTVLSHLDNSHRDKAMTMYKDALGNRTIALSDAEQSKLIYSSLQGSSIIPGVRPGIPATKLKGDAARATGAFIDKSQQDIADFERTELGGRRKASQKEAQEIIDRNVLKAMSDQTPGILTIAGRKFGLFAKPDVPFEKIPDQAKEDLLSIARHLGKSVTRDQLEEAYAYYQSKNPAGINKVFQ